MERLGALGPGRRWFGPPFREFAERARHREIEAHEGRILKEHRKRLARETAALIKEQARP